MGTVLGPTAAEYLRADGANCDLSLSCQLHALGSNVTFPISSLGGLKQAILAQLQFLPCMG